VHPLQQLRPLPSLLITATVTPPVAAQLWPQPTLAKNFAASTSATAIALQSLLQLAEAKPSLRASIAAAATLAKLVTATAAIAAATAAKSCLLL